MDIYNDLYMYNSYQVEFTRIMFELPWECTQDKSGDPTREFTIQTNTEMETPGFMGPRIALEDDHSEGLIFNLRC